MLLKKRCAADDPDPEQEAEADARALDTKQTGPAHQKRGAFYPLATTDIDVEKSLASDKRSLTFRSKLAKLGKPPHCQGPDAE